MLSQLARKLCLETCGLWIAFVNTRIHSVVVGTAFIRGLQTHSLRNLAIVWQKCGRGIVDTRPRRSISILQVRDFPRNYSLLGKDESFSSTGYLRIACSDQPCGWLTPGRYHQREDQGDRYILRLGERLQAG